MPKLAHPRPGIMNKQPPGPTCFMSCVIAVREYYTGKVVTTPDGSSPVGAAFKAFMRDHASGTDHTKYTKTALSMGGYYETEESPKPGDALDPYFATISKEIDSGRIVIGGVYGLTMGHAFVIYGYDDINNIYTADPILGCRKIPLSEIKSGYNGVSYYKWGKFFYTKKPG